MAKKARCVHDDDDDATRDDDDYRDDDADDDAKRARLTTDDRSRIAQRAYNNDAFGMIAKAASYSLFGAAITKVRRRKTRARATACG